MTASIPEDFQEWDYKDKESATFLWGKFVIDCYRKGIRVFHATEEAPRGTWAFYFVLPDGRIVRAPFEISQHPRFYGK